MASDEDLPQATDPVGSLVGTWVARHVGRQEAGVTGKAIGVPLHRVIAERHRLSAALAEGNVHAHLLRHGSNNGRRNSLRWVLVTARRSDLCDTKRCVRLDVSTLWVKDA